MKDLLTSLLALFLCALGPNTLTAAQEAVQPPYQGDDLSALLGLHEESAPVLAMLNWAGCAPPSEEKNAVGNDIIQMTFQFSRLTAITLELEKTGKHPYWSWDMPLGLTLSSTPQDVMNDLGWIEDNNVYAFSGFMSRGLGDRFIEGFTGNMYFNLANQPKSMTLGLDVKKVWSQTCTIIQELIPASQFSSDDWWSLLGADIASDGGDLLAKWTGVPIGGAVGEHEGLEIVLVEDRWIDRITFDSSFKGGWPFGLPAMPTEKQLNDILGKSTRPDWQPSIPRWNLSSARFHPVHVQLDLVDEDKPELVISCDRAEVNLWRSTITGQGAPSTALVDHIITMWDSARNTPDALLGRKEVTQGLFGEVTTWTTNKYLLGVIGGTIRDSGDDGLGDPTRRMEFLLRIYPTGSGALAEAQLDAFSEALKGRVDEAWELGRTPASKIRGASIQWIKKDLDFLESGPELRIEVQSTSTATELMLVINTPIK